MEQVSWNKPPHLMRFNRLSGTELTILTVKLQKVTQLLDTLQKDLQDKHLTSARESQNQAAKTPLPM